MIGVARKGQIGMTQKKSPKTSRRQPRDVEIDAHVGSRIHARRKLLGLSQTDLANGLGVTFQQLQKYEIGATRISAGRLYQCARFLNSGMEYFFVGLPATSTRKKGREKALDDAVMHSDETLKLVRGYYLVPADMRRRIRELIDAAAQGE